MDIIHYRYCWKCGNKYKVGSKCCKNEKKYNTDKKKLYNSKKWKYLRDRKLTEQPYCIRCFNKYQYFRTDNLELHHILALSDYPQYKLDKGNLVIICRTCNLEIGNSSKVDFDLPVENKNWLMENGFEDFFKNKN